jgi:hypothetical protein
VQRDINFKVRPLVIEDISQIGIPIASDIFNRIMHEVQRPAFFECGWYPQGLWFFSKSTSSA